MIIMDWVEQGVIFEIVFCKNGSGCKTRDTYNSK